MTTPVERLIDAAENMTPDEIHQHPMAAFDKMRALARELRLMRSGVVAEEPEWEYGRLIGEAPYQWLLGSSDISSATHRRTKAAPAGPWVPVKQEGAGHEGDS